MNKWKAHYQSRKELQALLDEIGVHYTPMKIHPEYEDKDGHQQKTG